MKNEEEEASSTKVWRRRRVCDSFYEMSESEIKKNVNPLIFIYIVRMHICINDDL